MQTNDAPGAAKVETPAEIHARKSVGWSLAVADAEPVLDYVAAQYRLVSTDDVGKTAWDLISNLFEAKKSEIDQEYERANEG